MQAFSTINGVSLLPGLLNALLPDLVADQSALRARFQSITDLPDDPKLAALVAIRDACRTAAPPAPDSDGRTIEVGLCGYSAGTRATLEARVGNRRLAVKAYADDPMLEATLYQALAAAGLGGDSEVRVP